MAVGTAVGDGGTGVGVAISVTLSRGMGGKCAAEVHCWKRLEEAPEPPLFEGVRGRLVMGW